MRVLRGDIIVEIAAKDIQVGDILYLTEDEEIPADCVVLYSSNPNGICYIQTTNIDGETNLKLRTAATPTQTLLSHNSSAEEVGKELSSLNISIECPLPNSHIYQFPALYSFSLNLIPRIHCEKESAPLSSSSLFLQVCHVRNTEFM